MNNKTSPGTRMGAKGTLSSIGGALLEIEARHLCAVAVVHQKAFPGSALTRLGPEAVRRYYEWQLTGPHEHRFIGALAGDKLLGFAVGGKSRGALSGFVHRNKYYLMCRLLLNPQVLFTEHGQKAILSALRALRRGPQKTSVSAKPDEGRKSFGIQVIAVDPALQGKGVGKLLMGEMERVARARGYARMHLTVNLKNTQAIAFYERIGWIRSQEVSVWEQRMEKILNQV